MNNSLLDPVQLTQRLIAYDTVNPPGRELRCAEFLADILGEAGFDTSLRGFGQDRANLIAKWHRGSDRAPLVFTGHIDVVPLGTRAWTRDPFAAEIVGDRLYGRGSSDMKSGVAAFVCAALRYATEAPQAMNLTLIITCGEETGCVGAASLVSEGILGPAGAMVVAEPTANKVCAGHKGALWLSAITTGIAAHGSMPEQGDNAIYKAVRVITTLESFAFNAAAHPTLGGPTLSVNTVQGGVNINSVPDRTEIGIDIRTVPSIDHAELRRSIEAHIGKTANLEVFLDLPGVWTSPELDWVKRVTQLACEKTGHSPAPEAATYFTDASVLRPAMGTPTTVILGPGEPGQAHQTDEWCSVKQIYAAVEIYLNILRDWSRAEG